MKVYPIRMRTPAENAKLGVSSAGLLLYEKAALSIDQIVSLGQDIYEAGVVGQLAPRYYLLVEHLKRMNLIHTAGRAFH